MRRSLLPAYRPGNMVFFVLGNMDFRQVVRWAEKLLADIPAEAVDNRRTPPPLYVPKNLVLHKDTHQAHIMIGSRGTMRMKTSVRRSIC